MKDLIVYFCDDMINIVYQNKVIQKKLASIKQGLVVDRASFMESFLSILKKEKIRSKLFGDKIYIVKDAYFTARDLFYLESLFTELGFIKVIYLDIYDYFSLDYTYIGVFEDYVVFYLDEPVFLSLTYFKDFPKLINYFQEYYQDYVVLFGTNNLIPQIKSNLVDLYYIDNYQNFISDSLLKVKKYDL